MHDLFTGKYAAFIGPAFAITAVTFVAMIASSLAHARRWRRRYEELAAAKDAQTEPRP
ncbi:MAG TPA: heme exporter protein CcmD [Phenylobacterium sp.]|nr:heme exporter protein CcmD [Phenylobacterium sp.]HQN51607.1 heme exporter protein CcmD [Phenylobacterium sp.]HQP20387.1 heme exporter protein CcmD [Phenylobacterium sp.]